MNKSKQQFPFAMPEGMPAFPGFGKESFEWMSNAFSEWLGNANRMQAEVIRFMGDRYSKDVKMMTRFAECRKPEDFLKLQSELAAELAADRLLQLGGAVDIGVFGIAGLDGGDGGGLDVVRGIEIRLTGTKPDDVTAGGFQLAGLHGHGNGGRRLDALEAVGKKGHDFSGSG